MTQREKHVQHLSCTTDEEVNWPTSMMRKMMKIKMRQKDIRRNFRGRVKSSANARSKRVHTAQKSVEIPTTYLGDAKRRRRSSRRKAEVYLVAWSPSPGRWLSWQPSNLCHWCPFQFGYKTQDTEYFKVGQRTVTQIAEHKNMWSVLCDVCECNNNTMRGLHDEFWYQFRDVAFFGSGGTHDEPSRPHLLFTKP